MNNTGYPHCGWCMRQVRLDVPRGALRSDFHFCGPDCEMSYMQSNSSSADIDDAVAIVTKPYPHTAICACCGDVLPEDTLSGRCEECAKPMPLEDELLAMEAERDTLVLTLEKVERRVRSLERMVRAHEKLAGVLDVYLRKPEDAEAGLYRALAQVRRLPPSRLPRLRPRVSPPLATTTPLDEINPS